MNIMELIDLMIELDEDTLEFLNLPSMEEIYSMEEPSEILPVNESITELIRQIA